jgi:gas vesicle protein
MTNDPEAIRQEIEETRSNLSSDVDALADKVSPSSIVQRRTERVKGMARKVKDSVMGAAEDARSHVTDAASNVGDKVGGKASQFGDAPHKAVDKAKGNPMAVGVIAFGLGLLAASLIPASEKEKELAQTAKDKAAPLVDDLKETAKGVAQDLKEPAKQAADSVKGTAADAVSNVKDDATSQAKDVKNSSGSGGNTMSTEGYVSPDSGASPLMDDEPVYDASRTDDQLR